MYESFYRLTHRPFAAVPDPEMFVDTPTAVDALASLERCVRHAGGVAVLTGPAGSGKTNLLQQLSRRLQADFGVIRIPNAGFASSRGFLQAILAEIGEGYEQLEPTELRLRLASAAKDARAMTDGIALLLDETHRYDDRLLEEVRWIANHIEAGRPLFRIVMAGQLSLEESLAEGDQTGLNERIGQLVTLPHLTADESRLYLDSRCAQAGGHFGEIFEPDAVETIVQACGGLPRCLNQLADHALLLGCVAERLTVSESLVREALDDLKRLPLQWHDPRPRGGEEERGGRGDGRETEEGFDDVVEIGSLDDESETTIDSSFETPERDWEPDSEVDSDHEEPTSCPPRPRGPSCLVELDPPPPVEHVSDRFARLDAVCAERRWLDDWSREEQEHDQSHRPNTTETAAEDIAQAEQITGTRSDRAAPAPSGDHHELPTASPNREETTARRTHGAVPKSATLFRDFRRRQGLT